MKQLAETINHYAPALTLLVVIGGFVWTIATWNAEFETLGEDLEEFGGDMEVVQEDVRSMRETLPHIVSCVIDLERAWITTLIDMGRVDSGAPDPGELLDRPLPASCEQARRRTTPRTN